MLVLYLMKFLGAQDSCFLKLYLTYNPNILLSTVWNGKNKKKMTWAAQSANIPL